MKYKILSLLAIIVFSLNACTDLEENPYSSLSPNIVFESPESYYQFLAKLYAGLAVTGQQGPAGSADIQGIDEGFSNYVRQYWKLQELSTDEAVVAWGDEGVQDFHLQNWTPANQFVSALYNRFYYQISLCNEFLRETSAAKLAERGQSDLSATIDTYRSEARFLRALSYWHALDLYGNVPFITENDNVGNALPKQATRQEIFNYVESELLAIENSLPEPRQNEYGRADKAAAWMLLAKLYQNASVYINQDKNTECITYCNKIINSNYSLAGEYRLNFVADNNNSPEIIFPVTQDGIHTQTWGGTTFLVHAAVGGSMIPTDYGINGGWGGIRSTSALVNQFPDETGAIDSRAMFYTNGQNKEIADLTQFTDGYAIVKYTNITSDGQPGSDGTHTDTDFPMFRLADAYLMYAESVVRGGSGGDMGTAVGLVNQLRERAYGNASGDITAGDLNLDFILAERSRELYWECHRRTDLIRFNKFTENGIWPWKGGVEGGTTTDAHLNLYPIPASDLIANSNLQQNPKY
ncbi:MAG: RagB/SusD family nutrient uptake outer membrane protein [Chitinophagales bacterium]